MDQLIGSEEFASTIGNFDSNFSTLLVSLLDQLSLFSTTDCEHNMTNIIHRLDFNGFYTEGLEKLAAERRSRELEEQDLGEFTKNSFQKLFFFLNLKDTGL